MLECFKPTEEEVAMTDLLRLMVKVQHRPSPNEVRSALSFDEYSCLVREHSSLDKALDDACGLLYGHPHRRYPTEIIIPPLARPKVQIDAAHERAVLAWRYQRRLKYLHEAESIRDYRNKLRNGEYNWRLEPGEIEALTTEQ